MISKLVLIAKAQEARRNAYAPYSNFPVGAAVQTASGQIITGCNIENASYNLCQCAERTALFTALSTAANEEDKTFLALAVTADTPDPVAPCGACRQVMSELCPPTMPIFMANLKGSVKKTSVTELLPDAFRTQDLQEINKKHIQEDTHE